jgi:pimeloyl-ACP methyl ester carboxylesterase
MAEKIPCYHSLMPHRLNEITVGGRTIRWRETDPGAPRGHVEPLVLLHAFPLSASMWEAQFDAFPGWRIIAPDTRGFRGPDGPPVEQPGEPTMDELAMDVEHVLDSLGVPRAVIGGVSMGGYLTFALFRRAPARFRGVVLANTRAAADSEEAKEGRRKMLALVDRGGPAAVADDMLPKLLGPTTHRERPEVIRRVRTLIEANSAAAIKGAIGAMLTRPDSRPLFPDIRCPTLILAGDEDPMIPAASAEEMHAGLAGSQLVTLPRCGHLANIEQPEAFNRALGRFLETLA